MFKACQEIKLARFRWHEYTITNERYSSSTHNCEAIFEHEQENIEVAFTKLDIKIHIDQSSLEKGEFSKKPCDINCLDKSHRRESVIALDVICRTKIFKKIIKSICFNMQIIT